MGPQGFVEEDRFIRAGVYPTWISHINTSSNLQPRTEFARRPVGLFPG